MKSNLFPNTHLQSRNIDSNTMIFSTLGTVSRSDCDYKLVLSRTVGRANELKMFSLKCHIYSQFSAIEKGCHRNSY